MKADRIDLGLTGYDELFISREERLDAKKPKVDELPLDELKPFKDHPFKVMEDEEMERLKESIRESGVLIPALARPTESGYELISGHRRLAACRALGMSTMPVIVRNLTDEEAIITMVDKTVMNREQFIRTMIEGKTIMEAPPAPLFQTVRMMKNVHFNLDRISKNVFLSEPLDEELLRQTLSDLKVCLKEITERCLPPEEREVKNHESRPHKSGPDRVR